jgi:hypothetical protein
MKTRLYEEHIQRSAMSLTGSASQVCSGRMQPCSMTTDIHHSTRHLAYTITNKRGGNVADWQRACF